MSSFHWDMSLSTGDNIIDEQHKKLMSIANNLLDADCYIHENSLALSLKKLLDYTRYHFTIEEKLMQKHNYAELETHSKIHQKITQELTSYIKKFEAGENISKPLSNFIENWLIAHVRHTDVGLKIFK